MKRGWMPIAGRSTGDRRRWMVRFVALATAWGLAACGPVTPQSEGGAGSTGAPVAAPAPGASGTGRVAPAPVGTPILFVHGNGDSGSVWLTAQWRFESAGWPRERLFAPDLPLPLARDDDAVAQPGRSSAEEHRQWLAGQVDRVLAQTGAKQVVLVGNSRGGNAIRNYLRQGGAAKVSHAVLGGTPNHGVWATDFRPGNEFNGKGPFLTGLNAPQGPGGLEITPGPGWLTLRSDGNDKFAQPDGRWIGQPAMATGVDAAGPELKGARNVVLPGVDHRETSTSEAAFVETFRFVTGREPAVRAIAPQASVELDGRVLAWMGASATNLGLSGAKVEVWRVSATTGERMEPVPLLSRTVGADGRWGPLRTASTTALEFVVMAEGHPVTHVYRSPFPRSTSVAHLRPSRQTDLDPKAGSVVTMIRPRGYFDLQRNRVSLDDKAPAGVPPGVAGQASSRLMLPPGPVRAVPAVLDDERIVMRSWPAAEGRVVVAEFHR